MQTCMQRAHTWRAVVRHLHKRAPSLCAGCGSVGCQRGAYYSRHTARGTHILSGQFGMVHGTRGADTALH